MSKHKHNGEPAPEPWSFGLPRTGVESHAHLNGKYYDEDRDAVLRRALDTGLAAIGQVFMGVEKWRTGREYFGAYPEVFFLLAVHPTEAQLLTDEELAGIRAAVLEDKRIRAIGETGLDYHWKDCPPEVQKEAFVKLLRLAREVGLPVSLHCRDAVEDCLELLTAEGIKGYPLVWHCFGGDVAMARRILDAGWHISVPGPVTFPANQALREAVAYIPADRLMMETDCPYLSPLPHRGKRNEPAYLAFTIQAMAEARGVSAAELWTSCGETARKFFRLAELGL